jgi:DNA-binding CsgD family transcriptional regulator
VLEGVGVGESAARYYEQLIAHPNLTIEEFSARLGAEIAPVRREIDRLEELGFVSRSPDDPPRLVPAPPEVAVEALVARQRERLERARLYASRLANRYRTPEQDGALAEYVEVIRGREAIVQRAGQLQLCAQQDVVVFVKPPFLTPTEDRDRLERRLLEQGIRIRRLYERAAFEEIGGYQHWSRFFDEGEEARVLPELPTKLMIADRRLGFLSLAPDERGGHAAALVRPCGVLDALNALVDSLWAQAVPVSGPVTSARDHPWSRQGLTAADREVLTLLQTGLTDQHIARQLAMSERTVGRRVRRLMDRVGAETRFQLGWKASEAGWLDRHHSG